MTSKDIGRRIAPRAAAALIVLVAHAAAQGAPCPVDGETLSVPASRPWNTGGGIDSDGCAWAIDGDGRRRVLGLDVVVECPRCGVALRVDDALRLRPTAAEVEALRAATAALGGSDRAPGRALERAAALLRDQPVLGRPGEDREAAAGELWLRAAWAAREAALTGEDGGYRPRDLKTAEGLLEQLEFQVETGVDRDPRLQLLGGARAELDAATADIPLAAPGRSPAERLRAARARAALADAARRLGELEELLHPGGTQDLGLELALARGWSRYGSPRDRERWLEKARARYGDEVDAAVSALRAGCAEEERLLGLAGDALAAAASRATGAEQARMLRVAGDAARRRADRPTARARLEAARALGGDEGAAAELLASIERRAGG